MTTARQSCGGAVAGRCRAAVALLVLLCALGMARAEQSDQRDQRSGPPARLAGEPLDVDQAVALALQQNPALRAFRKERAVAEGQVTVATALQNPLLRFDVLHVQETDASRVGVGAQLKWTPPQPFLRGGRRDAASAHVREVDAQIAEREWLVAGAVRQSHATLVELIEQERILVDAVALRRKMAALLRTRMQRGGVTALELNLADLAVLRAQREIDDLALRRNDAQTELAALLGVVSAEPVQVKGAPPPTLGDDEPPSAAALIPRALALRPALRAAAERARVSAGTVKAEEARRWPWPELYVRYRHQGTSGFPNDVQLGLELPLPVLNQNGGPLAAARAERERDALSADAQAQGLALAIHGACASLSVQRGILQRYPREVLPVIKEHERLLEAAARGAEIDLVTLLGGEELALRSRREHSEARLAYRRTLVTLETLVGGPLTEKTGAK